MMQLEAFNPISNCAGDLESYFVSRARVLFGWISNRAPVSDLLKLCGCYCDSILSLLIERDGEANGEIERPRRREFGIEQVRMNIINKQNTELFCYIGIVLRIFGIPHRQFNFRTKSNMHICCWITVGPNIFSVKVGIGISVT